MGIQLSEIDDRDSNILEEFFSRNNQASITSTFHPFPLDSTSVQWIALEKHKDRFYLAREETQIVGFSMLRGWDEGYEVPTFGIFVDIEAQGRGLGKQITSLTIEEASKLRCKKIRLSVYADNIHAYKIYKDLGFIETDRSEVLIDNQLKEKITMIKVL